MSLSHLNYFVPYETAGAQHENQLTRALLVVLRYSPMAHQAWLRLVSREAQLHELPEAAFATLPVACGSDEQSFFGAAICGHRLPRAWCFPYRRRDRFDLLPLKRRLSLRVGQLLRKQPTT